MVMPAFEIVCTQRLGNWDSLPINSSSLLALHGSIDGLSPAQVSEGLTARQELNSLSI